jgi:hypothetical protein
MRPGSPPEDHPTRPRGRPRVDAKMDEMISARLPTAQYRQLLAIAQSREIPVSTLVRELLIFRLR